MFDLPSFRWHVSISTQLTRIFIHEMEDEEFRDLVSNRVLDCPFVYVRFGNTR